MVGVPQAKQSIWLIMGLDPTVEMPARDRGEGFLIVLQLMEIGVQNKRLSRLIVFVTESFKASYFILRKGLEKAFVACAVTAHSEVCYKVCHASQYLLIVIKSCSSSSSPQRPAADISR